MTNLSDDEKIRILEVRAIRTEDGRRKSWEVVAEETHHAKANVIKVNKWFQQLPWEVVRGFPEPTQRLRDDYVAHLEEVSQEGHIGPPRPTTPLQHEAWEKCQRGDHSWLTDPLQDKFRDYAFSTEVRYGSALIPDKGDGHYIFRQPEILSLGVGQPPPCEVAPEGIIWPVTCELRVCYFCGHKEALWRWHDAMGSNRFTPREVDLKAWIPELVTQQQMPALDSGVQ
jgi:hypothetical protein